MKLHSPAGAMLWEIWRVTRVEAAWKFALGITGALTVMAWTAAVAPAGEPMTGRTFGAAAALACIVVPQFVGWMFLPRLNGHRPGFPLRILFTRPVGTMAMVGLPLAYVTVVPAAAYLASALLLKAVSGYPFPLLPVAAWIAALNLVMAAIAWSSRKTWVTTVLAAAITGAWMMLAGHRLVSAPAEGVEWHDSPTNWPAIFDFPPSDYALLALACVAAFVIAVARVARQRSGDAESPIIWTPGTGYPERLVNLFRIPCPASSATRAQVWFELKTRGLPALTIAVTFAIAIPLLFAVSVPIDAAITQWASNTSKGGLFFLRPTSLMLAGLSLVVMLFQGGNGFGFRYKQGRIYLTSFDMTQGYGTTRLAVLKLLVRSACFLAGLIIVGASAWASLPLLGDVLFFQMFNGSLGDLQGVVIGPATRLATHQVMALAVVVAIGAVVWVTTFAAHGALWIRYPRAGNIAAALLLLGGLALALLALAGRFGFVSALLVDATFAATSWIAAIAVLMVIAFVMWRGLAEAVLSLRYTGSVLVISAAFGAAWLTLLTAIGAQPAVSMLWAPLLALLAGVLAPWALNRVRHL